MLHNLIGESEETPPPSVSPPLPPTTPMEQSGCGKLENPFTMLIGNSSWSAFSFSLSARNPQFPGTNRIAILGVGSISSILTAVSTSLSILYPRIFQSHTVWGETRIVTAGSASCIFLLKENTQQLRHKAFNSLSSTVMVSEAAASHMVMTWCEGSIGKKQDWDTRFVSSISTEMFGSSL